MSLLPGLSLVDFILCPMTEAKPELPQYEPRCLLELGTGLAWEPGLSCSVVDDQVE